KCHFAKTNDEQFQASDASGAGLLNLTSIYEASSRFLPTSAPTMTSAGLELCKFKLGQAEYVATYDKQKIMIKNTVTNRWWQAVAKRKTDSLYQRCFVAKASFDIAIGDGAAMIALGDQMGILQPISAAQVPTDAAEQVNCKIDRFETKIRRSESAGATLVELKNHIDDSTTHFVITGAGSAPRTSAKKLELALEV